VRFFSNLVIIGAVNFRPISCSYHKRNDLWTF